MHTLMPVLPELMVPQLAQVPDAAPPYDCEIHGTTCQAPGGSPGPDPEPACEAGTIPVTAPTCAGTAPSYPGTAPGYPGDRASACTGTSGSGAMWPRQFAQAIVETLAGTRPFRQILPWSTERAQAQLQRLSPMFRTDTGPRIQRVLTSQPDDAVVEVTVIAGFGPRTRAIAMRFEYQVARQSAPGLPNRPSRWLCTDVETG
jgi:Family of unknown function (DUF6459)